MVAESSEFRDEGSAEGENNSSCTMSCLSWKCRGLGNAATIKELREFARDAAPTVLCILETQVHRSRVEGLKKTLGYDNAFALSSNVRSGG